MKNTNTIRILFLEDVPSDAVMVGRELRKARLSAQIRRVDTEEAFREQLSRDPPDLILSDHGLPCFDGLSALAVAREKCPGIPFIFVTNSMGEGATIEIFESGATDCILKNNLAKLAPAVQRALRESRERERLQRQEAALRESQERYRQLVELCPDALFLVDEPGAILFCNTAAVHLLKGRDAEDVLTKSFEEILPPEHRELLQSLSQECKPGIASPFLERELLQFDGSRVTVELSAVMMTSEGRPAFQILAHDIVSHKQAEKALEESEQRKAAILETALDAIISIDPTGRVQEWNPAAQRIFGYTRAEAQGRLVDELIVSNALRNLYQGSLTHYLMTGAGSLVGRPIELTLRRSDGSEFRAELAITRTSTDEPSPCTALIRDITRRKEAEAALRRSEERFRLIVEGVKDYAIYMLDANGLVETWNAGAERIEGYHADEILGRPFATFFTPEDVESHVPERALKRAELEGETLNEGWRLRKDGSRFWTQGIITALRDEGGKLRGFTKIARDMTRQKEADEQIQLLNTELEQRVIQRTAQLQVANEELEAFNYSVSHDLRAPLRHIGGYIEMLQTATSTQFDDTAQQHLQTIANAAKHMDRLIEALLAFSQIGRVELHQERVSMRKLVEEVRDELAYEAEDREVEWVIGRLPEVRGDRLLLRQAVFNLLDNALKYTRRRVNARIEVGADTRKHETVFHVRDNGAGFEMKHAQKLFGVFQRLHRRGEFPGTGIGLANVRRIIHRHGGRTWAEAAVNTGATFYFTLPNAFRPGGSGRRTGALS